MQKGSLIHYVIKYQTNIWLCGDRIWTRDLKVMSLASYQTALPRVIESFNVIIIQSLNNYIELG